MSKETRPGLVFLQNYLMGIVLCFAYAFIASFLVNIFVLILLSQIGIAGVLALPLSNTARGIFNFTISSLPGGYFCGRFIGKRAEDDGVKKALKTSLAAAAVYAVFYIVSFGNTTPFFLVNYLIPICAGLVVGAFLGAKDVEWTMPPKPSIEKSNVEEREEKEG